jgi:hypothetical protein
MGQVREGVKRGARKKIKKKSIRCLTERKWMPSVLLTQLLRIELKKPALFIYIEQPNKTNTNQGTILSL